jgi:hypothetical protein
VEAATIRSGISNEYFFKNREVILMIIEFGSILPDPCPWCQVSSRFNWGNPS